MDSHIFAQSGNEKVNSNSNLADFSPVIESLQKIPVDHHSS